MKTTDLFCTFDNVDNEILNIETSKIAAEIFTNNKISELIESMSKYNTGEKYIEHNTSVAKHRFITCTLDKAIDLIKDHIIDMHTEQDESY